MLCHVSLPRCCVTCHFKVLCHVSLPWCCVTCLPDKWNLKWGWWVAFLRDTYVLHRSSHAFIRLSSKSFSMVDLIRGLLLTVTLSFLDAKCVRLRGFVMKRLVPLNDRRCVAVLCMLHKNLWRSKALSVVILTAEPYITHLTAEAYITHLTAEAYITHLTAEAYITHLTVEAYITHLTAEAYIAHLTAEAYITHLIIRIIVNSKNYKKKLNSAKIAWMTNISGMFVYCR